MKKKLSIAGIKKRALAAHKAARGKVEIVSKRRLKAMDDLSIYYTPGVGTVSAEIAKYPKKATEYTGKGNMVAIVSDGSAVLGLGNIGPEAALPVMEGKAAIFKEFAGVNAFPIVLATQDTEAIIATVRNIAPGFGGINLEDIAAPRCFEIEERLKKELPIPVMHDDQHGTAIVVLAGLINAFKVVGKQIKKGKIVIVGAGAAGVAVAKLLHKYGVRDIVVVDRTGIIEKRRLGLSGEKKKLAAITNPRRVTGELWDAMQGADAVIGVSGPNRITMADILSMAPKAIVFALANPVPEIDPSLAKEAGAAVIATGRSDFPNQINNSLAFPGVFRGALDAGVRDITDTMKVRAAEALARMVKKPTVTRIIPTMFEKGVMEGVARAVKRS